MPTQAEKDEINRQLNALGFPTGFGFPVESALTLAEKASLEAELDVKIPIQALNGNGKADQHPNGRQNGNRGRGFGERVSHGKGSAPDFITRHIVVITDDVVDEFKESIGWYAYTLTQARGF